MPPWRDASIWRVLETDFGNGTGFLRQWAQWAGSPQRPGLLHHVAIAPQAPSPDILWRALRHEPALAGHAESLRAPWRALGPGFHRLEFDGGQVLLTLCVGPLQAMLREQRFSADAVWMAPSRSAADNAGWDSWTVKALARLCRRGTHLVAPGMAPDTASLLGQAGFVWHDQSAGSDAPCASFAPRWEPRATRNRWRARGSEAGHCAVVGAGLAGATMAAAMARRGWRVTVLDGAASPAQGASGLPVGLMAPQLSRDDGARSRLSRAGAHLTAQWCRRMLREGEDWAPSGVRQFLMERDPPGSVWHADGAWIKPEQLVLACLRHPAIRFVGSAPVQELRQRGAQWDLLGPDGQLLAQASQLVLAAAGGTLRLADGARNSAGAPLAGLRHLAAWQALGGQVSWGWQQAGDAAHFPEVPVNGHGSFVSGVPMQRGSTAWFAGATYETDPLQAPDTASSHLANAERLAQLAPQAAHHLRGRFDAGAVQAWRQTRHACADRLPAIGALLNAEMPSLWVSAAMGSRGLTYAVLGAEWLAAQICGEPWPVEYRLARLLDAARPGLSDHQ